jgi:hypothetical protein
VRTTRLALLAGCVSTLAGCLALAGCAAAPVPAATGPVAIAPPAGGADAGADFGAPEFAPCDDTAPDPATTDLRARDLTAADSGLAPDRYGEIPAGRLVVQSGGTLLLAGGALGAGSGYEAATGQVRSVQVIGRTARADVSLLVLDSPTAGRRVAFVELRLDDAPAVRWDKEPGLGIGTDGGDGGFVATGTAPVLDPQSAALRNAPYDAYDAFFPNGDSSSYHVCVLRSSLGVPDGVLFSTGWGDGWYGTYLGRDEGGNVVAVVSDGHVVPWEISGLPGEPPAGLALDAPPAAP